MNKEITYPLWKSIIWRFIRAGVAGGIANISIAGIFLKPDFSNTKVYGMTLAAAFVTGFISAAGLFIRDLLSETKSDPIQKLPI